MKKQLGIVVLSVGVVGFFVATQMKSKSQVFGERLSQVQARTLEIPVKAGSAYRFAFWGVDEEMGQQVWANLDFKATVTDSKGAVLFEKQTEASASSSEEKGGIKRAQNGFEYHHTAQTTESLAVALAVTQADYIDLEVYKDLPDWLNMAPGLSILLAIVGLVLFLRGRSAASA
ncbi:MAG: hypothetical protein K9N55_00880 [Phycisphaerae bacterium]|nr:hypothetical protein [Phycisphaerae bacterium]